MISAARYIEYQNIIELATELAGVEVVAQTLLRRTIIAVFRLTAYIMRTGQQRQRRGQRRLYTDHDGHDQLLIKIRIQPGFKGGRTREATH